MERGVMESSPEMKPVMAMMWERPEVTEAPREARMMMAVAESPVEVPVMEAAMGATLPPECHGRAWYPGQRQSKTQRED
jgi:hypothetical protein